MATPVPVTTQTPSAGATCASCRAALTGRYCAQCGEEAHDPQALTLRHFARETLVPELTDLDGKIWRTLRCLFLRPGFLTEEYCLGRRRLYINPFRILLTAIIVYALISQGRGLQASLFIGPVVLSVAPAAVTEGASVAQTVARIDRYGLLAGLLARKQQTTDITSDEAQRRFSGFLQNFAQPLSFTNVLLLAVALFALFRRRRPLLLYHAAFSMHFVSFALFTSSIFVLAPLLMRAGWQGGAALLIFAGTIWQFAYLAIAIRRFYFGEDRRRIVPGLRAAATALLVYLLNSAFITAVQLAGGAIALGRL